MPLARGIVFAAILKIHLDRNAVERLHFNKEIVLFRERLIFYAARHDSDLDIEHLNFNEAQADPVVLYLSANRSRSANRPLLNSE